jgi:exonuclease SbcD
MRKPIDIISNDWHIRAENISKKLPVIEQMFDLALSLGLSSVSVAGDVMVSRKAQTREDLVAFLKVLDLAAKKGIELVVIAGNHDKTSYTDHESYLSIYKHHPALKLFERGSEVDYGEVVLHYLPFYADDMWIDIVKTISGNLNGSVYNILISHQAIQGSVNNDGSKVSEGISASLLSPFDKVLLGHYHNASQPAKNVFHMPSIMQDSFGEDTEKGFTILYSDGSHELHQSEFSIYRTEVLNLDSEDTKTVLAKAKKDSRTGDNVRYKLVGSEAVVKAFKKSKITDLGIKVETKISEIEDDLDVFDISAESFKVFDASGIENEFDAFLNREKPNLKEYGRQVIKKALQDGN